MNTLYRLAWQFRLAIAILLFLIGFILGTVYCHYVDKPSGWDAVPEQLRHYP